ncbi:MAG: tandem-95 repeat protein [Bacteroidota bacterium]
MGSPIQLSDTTLQENSKPDTFIGNLYLDIAQEQQPRSVSWSLIDKQNAPIRLDGAQVYTNSNTPHDYEQVKSFGLGIQALLSDGRRFQDTVYVHLQNVNEPPTLELPDTLSLPEHVTRDSSVLSMAVQDPDSADFHTYTIVNQVRSWFYIDETDLRIDNPSLFDYEQDSVLTIDLQVKDRSGLTDQQRLVIRLEDRNDRPTDILLSDNRVKENQPTGYHIGNITVIDQDRRDSHTLSFVDPDSAGAFRLVDSTLQIADSSAFDFEQDSLLAITLKAVDNGGLSTVRKHFIHIQNVNEQPRITGLKDTTIAEDGVISRLSFTIEDPESHPAALNYRFATDNPDLLPRSGILMIGGEQQRYLHILPAENRHGTVQIQMIADDGEYADTARWNLNVRSVNDLPELIRFRPIQVTEGDLVNITNNQLRATDIDHQPVELTYRLLKPPNTGRFGFNTSKQSFPLRFSQLQVNQRMLWYQHDGSEQHQDTVWLSLSDPLETAYDSLALPIQIQPVNNRPQISTLRNQRMYEDHIGPTQSFEVWDAESPSTQLTVWGTSNHAGLIPDSSIVINGIDRFRSIQVFPLPDANGESRIQLHVSDGRDTTSTAFWVQVDPVNDAPRLGEHEVLEIPEDTPLVTYPLKIEDIDTPTEELDIDIHSKRPLLIPNDSLRLTVQSGELHLKFRPRSNQNGSVTLEYRVSDGEFERAQELPIKIEPVNDPPTPVTLFGAQPKLQSDSLTVMFRWDEATDVDDEKLEYLLHIQGKNLDSLITGIYENSFQFRAQRSLDSNTEYQWSVLVTDGKDTTAAQDPKAFLTPALPELPTEFALEQNFPNPFNPTTTITYRLPITAHVRVSVFDMSGRLLTDLVNTVQNPGIHHVQWHAEDQASGIYMYRIVANGMKNDRRFTQTDKMMLIK